MSAAIEYLEAQAGYLIDGAAAASRAATLMRSAIGIETVDMVAVADLLLEALRKVILADAATCQHHAGTTRPCGSAGTGALPQRRS